MVFIPHSDQVKLGDKVELIMDVSAMAGTFKNGSVLTVTDICDRGATLEDSDGHKISEVSFSKFIKYSDSNDETIVQFSIEDQPNFGFGHIPEIFNSKEEWDKHKEFLYALAPKHAPDDNPSKYPCIAIQGDWHDDPNGPYTDHYCFIYNFNIVKK